MPALEEATWAGSSARARGAGVVAAASRQRTARPGQHSGGAAAVRQREGPAGVGSEDPEISACHEHAAQCTPGCEHRPGPAPTPAHKLRITRSRSGLSQRTVCGCSQPLGPTLCSDQNSSWRNCIQSLGCNLQSLNLSLQHQPLPWALGSLRSLLSGTPVTSGRIPGTTCLTAHT